MRFLYAVLCLLLIAWAAFAGPADDEAARAAVAVQLELLKLRQSDPFPPQVIPPSPAVVPVPDPPRRETWPGFGTVEWRDGSWHKVADPGVSAAPRPFPDRSTTPGILVRTADVPSSSFPGGTVTAPTTTPVRVVGLLGSTSHCPPSG